MRSSIRNGATLAAKKFGSKALTKGATTLAKANPAFIAGDAMELGVEALTGSKNAGRATSAAVYLGAGAVVGGPVGAGVAAVVVGGRTGGRICLQWFGIAADAFLARDLSDSGRMVV